MGKPVKISFVADGAESVSADIKGIGDSFDGAAADAAQAGSKIDGALDSTAGHADTVASKSQQAAGALTGLGSTVGGPFGAAMIAGGTAMQTFADAGDLVNVVTESNIVRKIKDTAITVAKTAADYAATAASKAMTAGQWLLNAALSANPIGLVVLAVVALVAAFVIAYNKSDTFRAIVTAAFDKIKDAASAVAGFFTKDVPAAFDKIVNASQSVIGWVKDHWPLILAILTGPFGLAVLAIAKNWDTIKDGAAAVKTWISDKFDDVVGYVKGLPARFTTAASGMFDGIKDAFRAAINFVIDGWNGLSFTLPEVNTHIPGVGTVGGFTLSTPNIPRLAAGGIVNQPTLALIGEAGPEAVVPLNGRYGTTTVVQVNVQVGPGADPVAVGKELQAALDAYYDAGGRKAA